MVYTCDIILKEPLEGVYKAAQTIQGTLRLNLYKQEKIESVSVILLGKGKCYWSETNDDSTQTFSAKETYVSTRNQLVISLPNEYVELSAGTYSHPFKLVIPKDIPSSINIKNCTIKYQIVAEVVRAKFFRTIDNFKTDIVVYGNVKPCSPEPYNFEVRRDLFSFGSGKYVFIKGEIEKTLVVPGENIQMKLLIENVGDIPITSIKTELIKHFTFVSSGKQKMIKMKPYKETVEYTKSIPGNSIVNLNCIIPTLPSLYSIQHTKILIGDYKVRITAKFPFPHRNTTVEVPVVIGDNEVLSVIEIEDDDDDDLL